MSGRGYISAERPQQCDLCGKIAELRPYGQNGECICFPCGTKDPEARNRAMQKYLGLDVDTEPRGDSPPANPGGTQCSDS